MAKGKLEFELGQLKELLGQALRIQFETAHMEKDFLSATGPGREVEPDQSTTTRWR